MAPARPPEDRGGDLGGENRSVHFWALDEADETEAPWRDLCVCMCMGLLAFFRSFFVSFLIRFLGVMLERFWRPNHAKFSLRPVLKANLY